MSPTPDLFKMLLLTFYSINSQPCHPIIRVCYKQIQMYFLQNNQPLFGIFFKRIIQQSVKINLTCF
jgi:hypothetical protein